MTEEAASRPGASRQDKRYYLHVTPLRRFVMALMRPLFRSLTTTRLEGLENFPARGGVVLAANHLTNFDVFPMQLAIPRPIFFMGKAELFRNPFLDLVLRYLGGFPVQRGARDEWAMLHARRVLDAGQVLGIFPEGKRSKGVGLQAGKTGAARLSIASQCPLAPVVIYGTQRMFRRFPLRTPVTILVAPPLYPQPEETPARLTERLMHTLAAMLPPGLRGVHKD